jgi:hypothetical protein
MLFNELDLLEIRLNILDPHVDYFIIGEAKETFSGVDKPLHYKENMERFKKWESKIIYVQMEKTQAEDSFKRAYYQKDTLRDALKKQRPLNTDLVYFGDIDEIWKPQEITDDKIYNLQQLCYCYYLNNRSSELWIGTVVGTFRNFEDTGFNEARAKHDNVLADGGWHFTNMGGPDQVRRKLEAYDHQEFNNPHIKKQIEYRIANNKDYVGRVWDWQGRPFTFWVDEVDLPKFLLDNRNKYESYFK